MQFVLVDGEFDSNLFFLGHLQSLGIRGCLFGLRIAEQCLLSIDCGREDPGSQDVYAGTDWRCASFPSQRGFPFHRYPPLSTSDNLARTNLPYTTQIKY